MFGDLAVTSMTVSKIPGYVFINDNRTCSSGGGVGVYLNSDYKFQFRYDLRLDISENVWIEIQDLIIGIIYTTPSLSNRDLLDMLKKLCINVSYL